jgi:peroxidase
LLEFRTFIFQLSTRLSLQAIGPTHATIIATQFARLRRSDRFFYENGKTQVRFSLQELAEIKKVTFAHILCHNMNTDNSKTPPSN